MKRLAVFFFYLLVSYGTHVHAATYNDLDENEAFTAEDKVRIEKYLLPENSVAKLIMDSIFLPERASQDIDTFLQAGFIPFNYRKKSGTIICTHDLLSGYVVKLQLDTETRTKSKIKGSEWLIRRCEGVEKLQELISIHDIQHFIVPRKWLYPLPHNPSPPNDRQHTRKELVLLADKIELVNHLENHIAWKTEMTREHLDELYILIANSYNFTFIPSNVHYTTSGKFAFVDTEYRIDDRTRFHEIRPFLSKKMKAYWKKLVKSHKRRKGLVTE